MSELALYRFGGQALDVWMKRFGMGETHKTSPPPPTTTTNTEPFRIQDYTATAAQLEATRATSPFTRCAGCLNPARH